MSFKWFSSVAVCTAILLSVVLFLSPTGTVLGQSPAVLAQTRSAGVTNSPAIKRLGAGRSSAVAPPWQERWPDFFRQGRGANRPRPSSLTGGPILFNPTSYSSGGVLAFSVSVGYLNSDGNVDLVVANQCFDSNCQSGGVSVLLGNGDGTFQPPQSYPSGGYEAYAVAIGDVNGDGKADLIVANSCQSSSQCVNGAVGVLLGNGDGTFQAAQSYSSGGVVASAVTIADVNKDGNADLLVANQCQDVTCVSGGVS